MQFHNFPKWMADYERKWEEEPKMEAKEGFCVARKKRETAPPDFKRSAGLSRECGVNC